MQTIHHTIASHSSLDLATSAGDALHVLDLCGRNLRVDVPPKWISLWLPMVGDIDIDAPQYAWTLQRGDLLTWREQPLRAASGRPAWWLGLCGSHAAWEARLRGRHGRDPENAIFLHEGACPRSVRRLLVRLVRMARRQADTAAMDATAAAAISELVASQSSLHALLSRCKGRTRQRRQQVLMRLLRVEHLIRKHEDTRLDLGYLATSANYSPSHLIRSYRDVFDETPGEYAARLRGERAWTLVRGTDMPVCEITEALGFESQSAFCRAFKKIHGMTASQARMRSDVAPMRRAA